MGAVEKNSENQVSANRRHMMILEGSESELHIQVGLGEGDLTA